MRRLIEWAWRLEVTAHRHPVRVNLVFAATVSCLVLIFVLVPVLVEPEASLSLRDVTGSVLVGLGAGAMGLVITVLSKWLIEPGHRRKLRWLAAGVLSAAGSVAIWATARLTGIGPVVAVLLAAAGFPVGLYVNMVVRRRGGQRHLQDET